MLQRLRCAVWILRIGTWCAAAIATPAAPAEVRYSLALGADITASSDPLLTGGDGREAVITEASIRPGVNFTSINGASVKLDGALSARRYSRVYGEYLTGSIDAVTMLRASERVTLAASATYDREISADVLVGSIDAAADPRSVRNRYNLGASLDWRPTGTSEIRAAAAYEKTAYETSLLLSDTEELSGNLAYARELNERTRIGVRTAGSLERSPALPELARLGLFATLSQQLSPAWSVSTEVGAEQTDRVRLRSAGTVMRSGSGVQLSGQTQLCGRGERLSVCAGAALASESSGFGGLQRRFSLEADLTRVLGPRYSLSLEAGYQKTSARSGSIPLALEALQARAVLDWRLGEVTTLAGRVQYLRRDSSFADTADSVFVGVSLRWQPRL